jgi:hypothetical protein
MLRGTAGRNRGLLPKGKIALQDLRHNEGEGAFIHMLSYRKRPLKSGRGCGAARRGQGSAHRPLARNAVDLEALDAEVIELTAREWRASMLRQGAKSSDSVQPQTALALCSGACLLWGSVKDEPAKRP